MSDLPSITWTERSVKVADLVPFEHNPRRISEAQLERLVKSIREMGYHQRVLAQPDLKIIGGHQRKTVFERLGIDEVAVLVPSRPLTPDEYRRVLIQDNLPFGDWEMEELEKLASRGELQGWGMPDVDLAAYGKKTHSGLTDPNALPKPLPHGVSKPGQVWRCGGHRVGCGSSTDPAFVAKLLGGEVPMLMVTDPPYGVSYDPQWRARAGLAGAVAGTALANDGRADWGEAWALFTGAIAYVWHGGLHNVEVARSLEDQGFKVRAQIIWAKTKPALSRGAYHWQHKPALYAVKGDDDRWRFGEDHEDVSYAVRDGKTAKWKGGRKQTTLWYIEGAKLDQGHATQKPILCMQRPMLNHLDPGESCYDPFLGSGTSIIAAQQINRRCFGIDLEPRYVDTAVKRWEEFTGLKATDDATGLPFNSKP